MKVLILSAGKGSRLNLEMPKSLVKLDDRTMLEVQIEQLSIAGIDRKDITVITGYKNNLFSKHGLMTQNNEHYGSTGQVYSISCGTNYSNQKEVIIIYGDILFEAKLIDTIKLTDSNFIVPSFKNFKKLWQERGDCDFDDLETFIKDGNHNLLEIGNKVDDINLVNGQFMGILYFNNYMFEKFLKWYEEYKKTYGDQGYYEIQTTTFLNHLIRKNINIKTIDYDGYFRELDNEKDLKLIRESLIF